MAYGNEPQQRAKADWKALGEGKFLNWEDGETKIIVLHNWGQVDRDGRLNLEADVLKIDGVEIKVGEKIIRTNSINFIKAVKPHLQAAEKEGKNAVLLKISRQGLQANTKYFVEKVKPKETAIEETKENVHDEVVI